MNRTRAALIGVLAASVSAPALAQSAREGAGEIDRVLVTGLKPAGLEAEPGGQLLTVPDGGDGSLPSLGDFLRKNAAGVTISEPQGNPFQPELSYRGYSVSGLLGLPQGIAFYQNGARVNEGFGDVVNFDLIPEVAIDRVAIAAGANPLFGLNALGGAVAAQMKSGFSFEGAAVEASGGSFGRLGTSAEAGWNDGDWAVYGAGTYFEEDGWRDNSPSEVIQFYGDLARQFDGGEFGFSLSYADTDLNGNGAAPVDLLEVRREAVFTYPDNTRNEVLFAQWRGDFDLTDTVTLETGAYHRAYSQRTLNGDETDIDECGEDDDDDDFDDDDPGMDDDDDDDDDNPFEGFLCEADGAGDPAEDLAGNLIEADDVGEEPFGVYNRSRTDTDSLGATAQIVIRPEQGMLREATFGVAYDQSDSDFESNAEMGTLTEDRSVQGAGIFLGGDEFQTGLETESRYWGAYAGAALDLTERLALEISGRYNRADIDLEDQIGTALTGSHDFERLNPAIEATYAMPVEGGDVTAFARYAESNRTPTPAELSCADETQPCRFPNAFVADPPLEQVVAKGFEGGFSGAHDAGDGLLEWSVTAFRTTNHDDIIFVSSGPIVGSGYFRNAGDTRRAGLESWARFENDAWTFSASYSYIDATFRDAVTLRQEDNPNADADGEIFVEPGDRIPLIPAHSGQANLEWRFLDNWSAELGALVASSRRLRGDEAGDGEKLDGFVRFDAGLNARLGDRVTAFLRVENLLDEEYATFGTYGDVEELYLREAPDADDPRFVTPAAPRAVFAGVRIRM